MLGRFAVLRRHSGPQIPFKISVHFMALWYYITPRVLQNKVYMYVCMYVFVYNFELLYGTSKVLVIMIGTE